MIVLFVKMIFPSRELGKLPQGVYAKMIRANLFHTNIWFNVYDYELKKLLFGN